MDCLCGGSLPESSSSVTVSRTNSAFTYAEWWLIQIRGVRDFFTPKRRQASVMSADSKVDRSGVVRGVRSEGKTPQPSFVLPLLPPD